MSVATVAARGPRREPVGETARRCGSFPPSSAACRRGSPPPAGAPTGRSPRAGDPHEPLRQLTAGEVEIIGEADDSASDVDLLRGPGIREALRVVEENNGIVPHPSSRGWHFSTRMLSTKESRPPAAQPGIRAPVGETARRRAVSRSNGGDHMVGVIFRRHPSQAAARPSRSMMPATPQLHPPFAAGRPYLASSTRRIRRTPSAVARGLRGRWRGT